MITCELLLISEKSKVKGGLFVFDHNACLNSTVWVGSYKLFYRKRDIQRGGKLAEIKQNYW